MDSTRFAALISCMLFCAPWIAFAEEDAGSLAAKVAARARALRQANKDADADQLLREAHAKCAERVQQQPNDAQARFALAQFQFQLDQDEAAKANLELAIAGDPRCAAMHAFQGHMAGAAGDFAAAETFYRRALALNPHDIESRAVLAVCLLKLKREQEAIVFARETVRLAPSDLGPVIVYAGMLHSAGKADEWERALKSAIEANPDGVEVREFYALGLFALKRFDEAYAQRVEIAKRRPDEVDNEIQLLMVASSGNMAAEARYHIERLTEFRRTGKYNHESFPRELFAAASKKVIAVEFFDPGSKEGLKYEFAVYDKDDKLESRVIVWTHDKVNEHYRSQGKLKYFERAYLLATVRGEERQHYGIQMTQPTYDQARALATEIIEGKRRPLPPPEGTVDSKVVPASATSPAAPRR